MYTCVYMYVHTQMQEPGTCSGIHGGLMVQGAPPAHLHRLEPRGNVLACFCMDGWTLHNLC